MSHHPEHRDWIDNTAAIAPAVFGAAAGVILADAVDRNTRRALGASLAGIGLLVLAPAVVARVIDLVNGPQTRRGSQRRLRGIRDGAVPLHEVSYLDENELGVG